MRRLMRSSSGALGDSAAVTAEAAEDTTGAAGDDTDAVTVGLVAAAANVETAGLFLGALPLPSLLSLTSVRTGERQRDATQWRDETKMRQGSAAVCADSAAGAETNHLGPRAAITAPSGQHCFCGRSAVRSSRRRRREVQ